MKGFLKILGGSFVVFMTLSMLEEHEVFLPLLGFEAEAEAVPEPDTEALEAALRNYLQLWKHLLQSDGDPRFVERFPASPAVVGEILSEVTYLRHNQRRQQLQLMGLKIVAATTFSPDHFVVDAREYWVIRTLWLHRPELAETPRSTVLTVRYRMSRQGETWSVDSWEPLPAEPAAEIPSESTPAAAEG